MAAARDVGDEQEVGGLDLIRVRPTGIHGLERLEEAGVAGGEAGERGPVEPVGLPGWEAEFAAEDPFPGLAGPAAFVGVGVERPAVGRMRVEPPGSHYACPLVE